MKRLCLASLAVLSLFAPVQSKAEDSGLTGNVGLVSDYRFRGITQNFAKPALQGGFDYVHPSGFYVGNWNSQVNEGAGYPSGQLEMDFYGGFKKSLGDVTFDLGAIEYYYPGSKSSQKRTMLTNPKTGQTYEGTVSNTEVYIGVAYKWLSAKLYGSTSNYFSMPGTKGTTYLDLNANYDFGNGWGFIGHAGQLSQKGINSSSANYNYVDWKIGVTKDIEGWILGASSVWTNAAAGTCNVTAYKSASQGPYCFADSLNPTNSTYNVRDAGAQTFVLSVTKGF